MILCAITDCSAEKYYFMLKKANKKRIYDGKLWDKFKSIFDYYKF